MSGAKRNFPSERLEVGHVEEFDGGFDEGQGVLVETPEVQAAPVI